MAPSRHDWKIVDWDIKPRSTQTKQTKISKEEPQWGASIGASLWENWSSGFSTGSDTNWAVQPQKMSRGMKFRIKEIEGFYYPCSENKGGDHLHGYREADLRLGFRICKKQLFSWPGSLRTYNSCLSNNLLTTTKRLLMYFFGWPLIYFNLMLLIFSALIPIVVSVVLAVLVLLGIILFVIIKKHR